MTNSVSKNVPYQNSISRYNMNQLTEDMKQANGEAALIRKAYNEETWSEYEKCRFAFFPGCRLGAAEPEIIIKAYQSLLFQYPDTAIFLHCCGFPCEMSGDADGSHQVLDIIHEKWQALGKPTMIMACMTCGKLLSEQLPHIPQVSLYEILRDHTISGGCNSVDYRLYVPKKPDELSPEEKKAIEAIETLCDFMGVKRHSVDEDGEYPYITYSIKQRNELKRQGKDAVHILELVFGMGDSNLHMVHEHDHDHDHDNDPYHADSREEKHGSCEESNADLTLDEEISCDGNCGSCSSCGSGCENSLESIDPAVIRLNLPTMEEGWQNRLQLKKLLLEFFWNETMEQ